MAPSPRPRRGATIAFRQATSLLVAPLRAGTFGLMQMPAALQPWAAGLLPTWRHAWGPGARCRQECAVRGKINLLSFCFLSRMFAFVCCVVLCCVVLCCVVLCCVVLCCVVLCCVVLCCVVLCCVVLCCVVLCCVVLCCVVLCCVVLCCVVLCCVALCCAFMSLTARACVVNLCACECEGVRVVQSFFSLCI
jgi:hypothetical protein